MTDDFHNDVIPLRPTDMRKLNRYRFGHTDYGNAERLVRDHGKVIRYCPPRKRWLVNVGPRWVWDSTGEIDRLAKATVRGIYSEAAKAADKEERQAIAKHARDSEKANRIKAMIELASTELGVPVLPDELDRDPLLLNVANGTIDLRTGELRPHNRDDLITKLVPIAYNAQAKHELWDRFIREATGGDESLASFLQRTAGYCATGLTTEKHFFFAYSKKPGTGKSTYADAKRAALGDYAMDADFETWIERTHNGGNRGDLARLVGARVVLSVEVQRKAKFDAKLVKGVTGGDPITCAAKYEGEFTYRPGFKIFLAANDAPYIRDDDRPMFERCLRIPFDAQVANPDPRVRSTLADPTSETGPAILAWIVCGALMWQRDGLQVPDAVKASTAAYRAEVDRFDGFIKEHCFVGHRASVPKGQFRQSYESWCGDAGVRPLSVGEMGQRLAEIGVVGAKVGSVRSWRGVGLSDDRRDGGT